MSVVYPGAAFALLDKKKLTQTHLNPDIIEWNLLVLLGQYLTENTIANAS